MTPSMPGPEPRSESGWSESGPTPRSGSETSPEPGLAVTLALYTLARLGVVALVTVLLVTVGVPLLIAVLVGLVVALPLSMVLFKGLRARLDTALAVAGERRSAERAALRARLRGEGPGGDEPAGDEPAGDEPDPVANGSDERAERQSDGAGG